MDGKVVFTMFGSEAMASRKILITEIILLIYGVFLLIFPAVALNLSVGFIGVLLIIGGVFCGVQFVLHREDGNYPMIVIALVGIIVGLLALFFRSAIALVLFPVLLGVWTFCTAVAAGLTAYGSFRSNNGLWWIPLLAAIVALVVTVLVFMNLSGTERFMARILGIYFITYNLVRLGEYGAAQFATGAPVGTARGKKERSNRRPKREETYDAYAEDVDDDDDYEEYRRSRDRDRYDSRDRYEDDYRPSYRDRDSDYRR